MFGVLGNARNRADLHALGFVKMPDTLGAKCRIDLVNARPHEDGLIGAFGLANIAVDALLGDHQSHVRVLLKPDR